MPSSPTLTSTLQEHTGLDADELARPAPAIPAEELEPLPPLLPPEGVTASRLRDVADAGEGSCADALDLAGIRGSAGAAVVAAIARQGRKVVLVAADLDGARRAAEDAGFLARGALDDDAEDTGEGEVLVFAGQDVSPYADVNPDRRAAMSRMATLFHLAHDRPWSVLCIPASALARKVVPRKELGKRADRIVAEQELDRDALVRSLSEAGYLRVPVVEDPGSFAVRGALLDVWPPSSELPVRVELYGELVLSMKSFDPERADHEEGRGRSAPGLAAPGARGHPRRAHVRARPRAAHPARRDDGLAHDQDAGAGRRRRARPAVLRRATATCRPTTTTSTPCSSTYRKTRSWCSTIRRPSRAPFATSSSAPRATPPRRRARRPRFLPSAFYVDEDDAASRLGSHPVVALHRIAVVGEAEGGLSAFESAREPLDLASRDHEDLTRAVKTARAAKGKNATLTPLVRRIERWREHGMRVFVTARAQTQAERLVTLLRHQGVDCKARLATFDPAWLDEAAADRDVQVVVGPLAHGVVLPADGLVLVTEEEIFGSRVHRRRERTKAGDAARPFLEDLRSLAPGDYVVHVEHGIGRYHGPGPQERRQPHRRPHRDRVRRRRQAVPAGLAPQPAREARRAARAPRRSSTAWAAPRSRAPRRASRARSARWPTSCCASTPSGRRCRARRLPPADDDYRAFEATFPFDETADQARAIDEVNRDLESPTRAMDRLVCGDVGFGKTEVALRAAFRVAMAGKQVALLCPTTVLAQQHFRTFEARMAGYPVRLRALSRFQTKKEHDETLLGLKDGKRRRRRRHAPPAVEGRPLQGPRACWSSTRSSASASPTRSASSSCAPGRRADAHGDAHPAHAADGRHGPARPVAHHDRPARPPRRAHDRHALGRPGGARGACSASWRAAGRSSTSTTASTSSTRRPSACRSSSPTARIAVAHGQMSETALEETMLDFVDGRYDVLASTAIIESGLDIPRANTMIIDRADLFGLAQLYQLRGRVGRSKERAYCYLVVPPPNAMTDESRSRIEALERHTELGSGFQIASLDLELRGAGDLLGGEQSGNVASVGLRPVLPNARRGRARAARRGGHPRRRPRAQLRRRGLAARGLRDRRRACGCRSTSAWRARPTRGTCPSSRPRWRTASAPPPEEARRLVKLMALKTELRRLRVLGCEASGAPRHAAPARRHAARSRRRSRRSSARRTACGSSLRTCA